MSEKQQKLNLWRHIIYLIVDEAMNLILGSLPGKYKFDLVDEKDMPDGSAMIYKILIESIKSFELKPYFKEMWGDDGQWHSLTYYTSAEDKDSMSRFAFSFE